MYGEGRNIIVQYGKIMRNMYIKTWNSSTSYKRCNSTNHDDVIKWKHFPRYWNFVGGIHRSPLNSPYKGQWRGALMFSLICAWINAWVNNGEAGDLRRHLAHYDVILMPTSFSTFHFYSILWQQWQNNVVQLIIIINSKETKKREIWFMDCY